MAVPNATEEEQNKTEKVEDLEESIKKLAPVRPWDIGKEGARPGECAWPCCSVDLALKVNC